MAGTSQFKPKDRVKVRPDDPGPFAGLYATVDTIQPDARGINLLDRYVVVFEWGEKQSFFAAQLLQAHTDE